MAMATACSDRIIQVQDEQQSLEYLDQASHPSYEGSGNAVKIERALLPGPCIDRSMFFIVILHTDGNFGVWSWELKKAGEEKSTKLLSSHSSEFPQTARRSRFGAAIAAKCYPNKLASLYP
jgi:hypothetical protein